MWQTVHVPHLQYIANPGLELAAEKGGRQASPHWTQTPVDAQPPPAAPPGIDLAKVAEQGSWDKFLLVSS